MKIQRAEYRKYPIPKHRISNFEEHSVRAAGLVSTAIYIMDSPEFCKIPGNSVVIRTGELSMLWRLFLLFLIWLFSALESRGLRSSKLQSSSPETDMTAPQLSNSPQYCTVLAEFRAEKR